MQRIAILCLLLMVVFVCAVQAQAPVAAPKPDPELKKLAVWVGHWTFEGEMKAGPLGPAGKVALEYTGRMTLDGFFYQGRWTGKGAWGEMRGFQIDGYDPVKKNFVSHWYQNDGNTFTGELTVTERTYTWTGEFVLGGKPYHFKDSFTFAPDFKSAAVRSEISLDGKTWTPFTEGKYTKTEPAPKK